MQMNHTVFAGSPALRVSLKRGLARQAIGMAERSPADMAVLIRTASELRPNAKSAQRLAARIAGRAGVVRAALTRDRKGLTFIARTVRDVEAQVSGETAFHETGLIYLRVQVGLAAGRMGFQLSAVSFCRHALERLVERSDLPLDAALLPQVDAEAVTIFRGWEHAARIAEAGDDYYPAAYPGVWAGGHDLMALDPDWSLRNASGHLPVFSARTFLSPAEMRPTVWLRWKADPACCMG